MVDDTKLELAGADCFAIGVRKFECSFNLVQYVKDGDEHFMMTIKLAVSDQFSGWLLGFVRRAKLIS